MFSMKKIQELVVYIKVSRPSLSRLRDIRTSTYQMCRIKEIPIEQPNFTKEHVI